MCNVLIWYAGSYGFGVNIWSAVKKNKIKPPSPSLFARVKAYSTEKPSKGSCRGVLMVEKERKVCQHILLARRMSTRRAAQAFHLSHRPIDPSTHPFIPEGTSAPQEW